MKHFFLFFKICQNFSNARTFRATNAKAKVGCHPMCSFSTYSMASLTYSGPHQERAPVVKVTQVKPAAFRTKDLTLKTYLRSDHQEDLVT